MPMLETLLKTFNLEVYRLRLKMRKLSRDKMVNAYLNKPSISSVKKCQDEISSLDRNPYYMNSYRAEELYYWLRIPQWIYEDFANHRVERCLDIGSAFGTLALYCHKLTGCSVYCVDVVDSYRSRSMFKKYNFHFKISNIELDPAPFDVKFDVIILTEILEHFNFNPVPTLKKIGALLAEGGKLYLSTPDASEWGRVTKYYSAVGEMPYPRRDLPMFDAHIYQYNKEELLSVLGAAGFKVDRFGYSPGYKAGRHFNLTLVKN
jgi:SAM-dependent methyltransferase